MAKTYTNISSLMAGLQQELHSAMNEISLQGLMKAHENASEFYDQGDPKRYKRTGTYGTAPNTDGVKGFGNVQEVEIYMEEASAEGIKAEVAFAQAMLEMDILPVHFQLVKFGRRLKIILLVYLVKLVGGQKLKVMCKI